MTDVAALMTAGLVLFCGVRALIPPPGVVACLCSPAPGGLMMRELRSELDIGGSADCVVGVLSTGVDCGLDLHCGAAVLL